ncbi:uncharacterized protein ISCGN_028867 [Ixodes scapularis]
MRLSGPPKKRRDAAPNRIPPMWTSARAPAVTPPVWRFPPLRSPFFVPAPFLAGGADGGPPPSMSQGGSGGAAAAAAAAKRDKAKIVQFEWNGCTFYRYIPDGGKLGGGRLMPGEPPFGRPRGFEWQQRGPRSQSRRRKQVVPPLRAAPTAPPWSTPGLPERKPYGAAPFRPRDNPRIPRKDNKAPSSHLHLPPFLVGAAAAADKPTTSGSSTKSQSPASTTSNLLGPPPRSGIFQCRPKDTAFPFSVRSYRTPDDCLPPLQPKRETAQTKAKPTGMTIHRSQEIPESDLLGAKPKRPLRMTTTVKPERSASSTYSNASSSNKTFSRAPPFRNNPRVYSSTVLKDFNLAGKQDLAENPSGDRGPLVMATPKRDSPPKEQRRPERRVRYKAEIVGSNIIVTREEASPDKKQEGAFDCSKAFAIERQVSKVKEGEFSKGESSKSISAAKEPPITSSEEETAVLNQSLEADLKTGQGAEGLNPAKADAFTQLSDDFATNVGDKLVCPRQLTLAKIDILSPADSEDDGKFRSVSVQTRTSDTPSEMQLLSPGTETEGSRSDDKDWDSTEKPHPLDDADMFADRYRQLTDEERNCMSEDPPTSSSEIYLDSLVSNGTSSSSPKDDAQGKLRRNGTDGKTDRTALLMEDLDILLKDCSPIKSADEKSSCESNPNTSSTPCLDPISNDDSGSSRDEFLEVPKLAKDLGDTISTTSDVILINFAEDTTTLKEHLDGIVADYKSKAGIDTADSGCNDLNVLESYAGSSLAESNAPVLKPADVSPVLHDAALEDAAAGDYSQDGRQGCPPPMKTQQREVISDRGDQRSLEYTGYTVAHGSGPGVTGSSDESKSYCNSCGVYSPCCNSMDSEGVVRVCSCKTRLARKRDVCKAVADVALKEEYRDPEIVPCFAEESVEYLLLESEEEEYEEVKRRVATGQPGEERKRYPENSNSWNKRDTISDQEPEQNEAGASRGLIYDCPWWIHDHAEDAMCKKLVKEDSSSVGFTRELAPAALNPWSLLTAQNKESGLDCGGPSGEGTNPWIPFLAGPKVGVMMSSGDHHGSAEARPTRSDADFSTLYMEGQPRKPLLKQHWAPLNMTPEELRARGLDRDSLSFYEFPMNEQQDTHAQSLSLETLVGSNHQDAASTSPAEGGRLAEGELRRGSLNGKATGSPSDSQYCEVELYAPVNKSGPAVCTVVVPSHPTSDADGSKGDVLVDGGPGASTPPDDVVDSCGDKKAAENKPMGKIRTRFRDFFWKHK